MSETQSAMAAVQDAIVQRHASTTVFNTPEAAADTSKPVRALAAAVLADIETFAADVNGGDPTGWDRLRELRTRLGAYAS